MRLTPRISVLLPIHNAAPYLQACLASLQEQTFSAFEVIAIDDASTDGSGRILDEVAALDSRLRVRRHNENRGIVAALNQALELAHGEFIARLDADDEALPHRFARQVEFLDKHPSTDLVSSSAILIDEDGRVLGDRIAWATRPASCRFVTCFATPLIHPGLMARRRVLAAAGYSHAADATHVEDYELFSRLVNRGHQLANLAEPLLRLRQSRSSVSHRFEHLQVAHFVDCARRHITAELSRPIPSDLVAVATNRVGSDTRRWPIAGGLSLLKELACRALQHADEQQARLEILDALDLQSIEILVRVLRRGRAIPRGQAAYHLAGRVLALFRRRPRAFLIRRAYSVTLGRARRARVRNRAFRT